MNKTLLIIQREFVTRVRKKSFIIMTLLGPLLFAAVIVGSSMIIGADDTKHHILIVDELGFILEDEVIKFQLAGMDRPRFRNDERLSFEFRKGVVNAQSELKSELYTDVLELKEISYTDGKATLFSTKSPGLAVQNRLKRDLEDALELMRVKKNSIPVETYKSIRQPVDLSVVKPGERGLEELNSIRSIVGFVFSLVIFFFIFFYGVQVMRAVMEEKTNRIVEVIISSVKPFQLMMGKIVGLGLVGLTQFVVWAGLTAALSILGVGVLHTELLQQQRETIVMSQGVELNIPSEADFDLQKQEEMIAVMAQIPWTMLIVTFAVYFILGYLMYAALFAAIGAAVDNETDSQQFMLPVTLPLMLSYMFAARMIENPDGIVGQILAIFPLTSPVIMMIKAATGVEWYITAISIILLIATILLVVWFAGRIYRVGILMYGKKISYRELIKWMRYT
jgi:ABC-2 type transport system permease protein